MSDYYFQEFLIALVGLLGYVALSYAVYTNSSKYKIDSLLVASYVAYFGISFVSKFIMYSLSGWETAVDLETISTIPTPDQIIDIATATVVYEFSCFLGIISFLLIKKFLPSIKKIGLVGQTNPLPSKMYYTIFGLVLLIKFVVNFLFGWGVPAKTPELTIPLVTGFSVLLSREGALFLCLIALHTTFINSGDKAAKLQSIIFTLLYLFLDLSMGSKYGLIGLSIGLIFLRWEYINNVGKIPKVANYIAVALLILMLPLYQFLNILRFVRIDESLAIIDIIKIVFDKADIGLGASILAITSRATGIEGLVNSIINASNLQVSFPELFITGEFKNSYTFMVTGMDPEGMGIGATLAGTAYVFCNANLTCFSATSFVISFFGFFFFSICALLISRKQSIQYAYASMASILFVHMQLSSGNITYHFRGLIVVVTFAAIVSIFRRHLFR